MKFGSSFTDIFKSKCTYLWGYIHIWHFYRTLSRGLLFPGHSVWNCRATWNGARSSVTMRQWWWWCMLF